MYLFYTAVTFVQVQRRRVRDVMLQLNPEAVRMRSVNRLHRRTYSVAGPNSVWHIDGNHKLIRFVYISDSVIQVCSLQAKIPLSSSEFKLLNTIADGWNSLALLIFISLLLCFILLFRLMCWFVSMQMAFRYSWCG